MPLSNLLKSAAGTCLHCGQKASILSREHPQCPTAGLAVLIAGPGRRPRRWGTFEAPTTWTWSDRLEGPTAGPGRRRSCGWTVVKGASGTAISGYRP